MSGQRQAETEQTQQTQAETQAETRTEAQQQAQAETARTETQTTQTEQRTEQRQTETQSDWRDRRIAQLTAQLKEARERASSAEQTQTQTQAQTETTRAGLDESEVERRANVRAAEIARINQFNASCNEAAMTGRAEFSDFDSKLGELKRLVTPGDATSEQAYYSFLAAALETGQAHKLIYRLGSDLNEASRVLGMSPVKQAMELTKLAQAETGSVGSGAGAGPSSVPRPIRPVGNVGPSNTRITPDDPERADGLSTAEWMARRNAQTKERGIA